MISRLTAFAACFAVLSAATITFAASATAHRDSPVHLSATAAQAMPIVQMQRVEVIGRRAASAQR
ncbi:MAG TPA: hypothetical protein VF308_10560 [Caldimonas sp.]